MKKALIIGAILLTSTQAQGKDWLVESHFMIGRENSGYKVLGASAQRKIFNIFNAYGELDLMPDNDIFSGQRFNSEIGIKARVQAACGLYLSAGAGLSLLSS